MTPRGNTLRGRVVMLLISAALALMLTELGLRLLYPTLPSLSPLVNSSMEVAAFDWTDFPPQKSPRELDASCLEGSYIRPREPLRETRYGPDDGVPVRLWVAGDSVALGFGVGAGEDYGSLLATKLAEATTRPVLLRNLAMNGAGFCAVTRRLDEHLASGEAPDLVLLGFFGDDLEDRAVVAVHERPVAFPDRARPAPLRPLVSHSYVANLVWYGFVARSGGRTVGDRYIDAAGQQLFQASLAHVTERVQGTGGRLVVSLLPPAGLHLCPASTPEGSRCQWLGKDLDLLAELIGAHELAFVDLRGLWSGRPAMIVEEEHQRMREGRELAIHPNPQGHALIAQRLWPTVQAASAGLGSGE